MAVDDRLVELLLRWEELRDQGQLLSAEELCRDCPDLLEEVRRRLKNLRSWPRSAARMPKQVVHEHRCFQLHEQPSESVRCFRSP
jgi:hypothetical protein